MRRIAAVRAAACLGLLWAQTGPARANPASEALRAKASQQVYNLDRDLALETFRQAVAADPKDAGAHRGVATTVWLNITFRRGSMTVDDYLGRDTRPNSTQPPPPPEFAAGFRESIERALALARARVAANPRDADGHFQLGSAVGLRASYTATVEGSVMSAFRAAREAYDEHERVLSLDPKRKDAGLIAGTYRYIVSTLALPMRLVAYVVGFGGGREHGLRLIEEAAAYPGDNQDDARFALVLLYNREKRYDDALKVLAVLRERYPRNRLAWLETGSTNLRAGQPAEAERILNDGMTRFASDTRQRMFGEDALWLYKRGMARAALGKTAEADADLKRALGVEGRKWVYGRTRLELGKLALKRGDRAGAHQEFQQAITLCQSDNDPASAAEARSLMK